MATPRSKRKLAALNKESCEKRLTSTLAQNSNVPRSQEDYRTQVFEEIEGRVTKKLSQEFSKTEKRTLAALSRLDDFLMNPLVQGHSGTVPETSQNAIGTNQGTNEKNSESDPHPEASIFRSLTTRNSRPEEGHDSTLKVKGKLKLFSTSKFHMGCAKIAQFLPPELNIALSLLQFVGK